MHGRMAEFSPLQINAMQCHRLARYGFHCQGRCVHVLLINFDNITWSTKKIKLKGSATLMTHRIRIGLHLKTTISIMHEPKLWNRMGSLLNYILVKPNLTSWSTLEYQTLAGTVNNRQRKCIMMCITVASCDVHLSLVGHTAVLMPFGEHWG